jgi:hypothetical protein
MINSYANGKEKLSIYEYKLLNLSSSPILMEYHINRTQQIYVYIYMYIYRAHLFNYRFILYVMVDC